MYHLHVTLICLSLGRGKIHSVCSKDNWISLGRNILKWYVGNKIYLCIYTQRNVCWPAKDWTIGDSYSQSNPTSPSLFWWLYSINESRISICWQKPFKSQYFQLHMFCTHSLTTLGICWIAFDYMPSALRTRFCLSESHQPYQAHTCWQKSLVQCSAPSGHPVEINWWC